MNKTHRTVWSHARQCYVAAAENARSRGKGRNSQKAVVEAVAAAIFALGAQQALAANCVGGTPQITTCLLGNSDNVDIGASNSITTTTSEAVSAGTGVIAGHISNAGTISSNTNYGLYLNGSTLTGGIFNTGLIKGTIGLNASSSKIQTGIVNASSGTISGTTYAAINIATGSSLTGGITNSGLISGQIVGINISSSAVSGGITNGGHIAANSYGIYLNNATLDGSIANTGTISVNTTNYSRAAVYLRNSSVSGSITNSGRIEIATTSEGANGIYIQGSSIGGSIVNSGTIMATGASSAGIGLYLYNSSITGGITNSGRIEGTSTGGSGIGILISNSVISGGITNSGLIRGASTGIKLSGDSTVSSIVNLGTIVGTSGYGIYNSGMIDTLTNAQGAGNTAGALTFRGALPTTYNTYLGANASTYGKISFFNLNSYTLANYGIRWGTGTNVASGTTYTAVITSDSALTVPAGTLAYNGATYHLVAENGANLIYDLVVDSFTAPPSTGGAYAAALAQSNSPGYGAARVIDASPTLTNLFSGLSGNQAISNAVSQTLPLLTGAGTMASRSALSAVNKVIQARIESQSGLSSGETFYGDKHFWMKPFGSLADQDDRNGVSGFKAGVAGLALGLDSAISDASRIGASFVYAKAHIKGNSDVAPNVDNTDVYALIGYGSYRLESGAQINYQGDIGNNKNEGRRDILFAGTTASSSYSTQTAHAGVGLGKSIPLSQSTTLTPSVRLDYTRMRDAAYNETGAGALNLNVNRRTMEELIIAGDGKVSYMLNEGTTLLANAGLGYDTMGKTAQVVAAFAGESGASFTTTGMKAEPWLVRGGLGFVRAFKDGPEITARYDVELRQGFNNQTISAKLRWAF